MSRLLLIALAAATAFAADDPWAKVKELKTGTEVRIFKKGSMQPVLAQMDELTDENLLVILKKEQAAIPREQIDRIDARPSQPGGRVKVNSETKTTEPDTRPGPPGHGSQTPGTSTTSGLSIGSKPDFETIYRRPSPRPPQKPAPAEKK
jgi:hypothetical protein